MPWKECHVMDERLRFVSTDARRAAMEAMNAPRRSLMEGGEDDAATTANKGLVH